MTNQNISGAQSFYQRAYKELQVVAHSPKDEIKYLNSIANSFALKNKADEAVKTYQQVLLTIEKSNGSRGRPVENIGRLGQRIGLLLQ